MYDIRGIVQSIGETKSHKNDFRTREVIITRAQKIHKQQKSFRVLDDIRIQFCQDRVLYLDKVNKGDDIKIGFDVKGRWWNNGTKNMLIQTLEGFSISSYGKPIDTHLEDKDDQGEIKYEDNEDKPKEKEDDSLPF